MLDFIDFKTMLSVLDRFSYKEFDPVVVDKNQIFVSDGHVMCLYMMNTEVPEKFGISKDDTAVILKSKASRVYFKDTLYVDNTAYTKSQNFFAYDKAADVLEAQKCRNTHQLPLSHLPECNGCLFIVLNKYGVLYLSKDLEILKSIQIPIPEMENTTYGYFCARYVYFKNLFKMFRHFRCQPQIMHGGITLYFKSSLIKGVLSMYLLSGMSSKNWNNVKNPNAIENSLDV